MILIDYENQIDSEYNNLKENKDEKFSKWIKQDQDIDVYDQISELEIKLLLVLFSSNSDKLRSILKED